MAGGAVFVTDTLGPVWVWSEDGLFLGHIYHDFGSGIQDDQVLYGEIQATAIHTDPKTGRIYSIANDTGAHIHEVVMPRTTALTGSRVLLRDAEAARAQPWDPDGPPPTERPSYVAYPVVKLWVDENTNILKRQEFALSGRAMRTLYYPRWNKQYSETKKGEVWFPGEIRIYDEVEKANSTIVVIKTVDLRPLEANLFTKSWLESKAR